MEKKTLTIAGKVHDVEIKNGIPYIDGKRFDDFVNSLTLEEKLQAAIVGKNILEDPTKSPQKMFNELHQEKNN